jgi:hypothetical protein
MSEPELFHVGIVVKDLEAARARFTELVGTRWGPIMEPVMEWTDGDGVHHSTPQRLSYSEGPPHLELIEEIPGTGWVCNEHSNLHHIGYSSEAIVADSHRIGEIGCPLQAMMGPGPDPQFWVMHGDDMLVRIELVDAEARKHMKPMMTAPED